MLDEATIERIVRQVIQRLLEKNPGLIDQSAVADGPMVTHHHGRVLTEFDLIRARRSGHRVVTIGSRTIVTPLARDRAHDMGIDLQKRQT